MFINIHIFKLYFHLFSQSVVSDCGKYLILAIVKDCRDNIVYYADLTPGEEIKSELNVKKIITKFESDYDVSTTFV